MPVFESRVVLPCPPREAYEFLLRPANVLPLYPPEMGLSFRDPPEVLKPGSELHLRVQAYGQTQDLIHRFDDFDSPQRFCERQVKGPMKLWVHEHLFETPDGHTVEIVDRVEFQPPGGLLGFLLTEARIKESLLGLFTHRATRLREVFAGAGG